MDFIKELQEARLTRNRNNQKKLTYTDCKERAYLVLMMLHAMSYYRSYRPEVAKYANKTVIYRDYQRFRIDSTDLYNFLYFVAGERDAVEKLRDPESARAERDKILLSVGTLNGYLRNRSNNKTPTDQDLRSLQTVETDLGIQNSHYKSVRRSFGVFANASPQERKQTVTRLLFAARAKLSDSDLMPLFSKFATDNRLEDFDATDPELEIHVPDTSTRIDVYNYKFLVPVTRLPYVQRFLANINTGKAIPAQFASSYIEIIKMVHDIVRAGPAYIEQFKQVHKRAKRTLKK